MDAYLLSLKETSGAAKAKHFNGNNFKRWKQKIQPVLEFVNTFYVLLNLNGWIRKISKVGDGK